MPKGKKNDPVVLKETVYSLIVTRDKDGNYQVETHLGNINYKSLKEILKEERSNVRMSKQAIKAAYKLRNQGPNQE